MRSSSRVAGSALGETPTQRQKHLSTTRRVPTSTQRRRHLYGCSSPGGYFSQGATGRYRLGVDAYVVRRENRAVGVEPQTAVVSEIAWLRVSIDRAAASTEITLASRSSAPDDDDPGSPVAEQKELRRQLAALRERVALAEDGNEDLRALRAELATLLFFAKTLRGDADSWRSTLEERVKQLERQRTAARRERERLAAEREKLVRRRDALQLEIVQTAARMAQRGCGECRRTVPVFTLGEGLTVSSVSVFSPRKGLRFGKHWLVTLNGTRDNVVVRSQ
jgi:hypothetical protein